MLALGLIFTLIVTGFAFSLYIHECGHYWCYRALGIKVESIVVGVGPAVIKKRIGDLRLVVRVFPLRAHLKTNIDTDQYFSLPLIHRILLSLAGPATTLIVLFVLVVVVACCIGCPVSYLQDVCRFYDYIPGIPYLLYGFYTLLDESYLNLLFVLFVFNSFILFGACLPVIDQDLGKVLFNLIYLLKEKYLTHYIHFSKLVTILLCHVVMIWSAMDIYRFVI